MLLGTQYTPIKTLCMYMHHALIAQKVFEIIKLNIWQYRVYSIFNHNISTGEINWNLQTPLETALTTVVKQEKQLRIFIFECCRFS